MTRSNYLINDLTRKGRKHGVDDLLSKIYDKVIFQEADSQQLDASYDDMVSGLLTQLGESMPDIDLEKVSDAIYTATYQARKDGFLLGAHFMTKLLAENLGMTEGNS